MKPRRSVGIMLGLFLAAITVDAASAQAVANKSKGMGSKVSTVTTFENPKSDNSGKTITCQGTCIPSGTFHRWTCDVGLNETVMCSLKCRPPPIEKRCLPL